MDFALTEAQRMTAQMVRDFAATVAPRIRNLDRAQQFDRSVLAEMARLGILGLCLPERYGGGGMDYISLGLACEELEYVDTSLRVIMSVHVGLNSLTVLSWGTEEQKQRYLVPQARGERIATYGLTEPAAGSDAVGIRATAVRDGRHYVLSGEKIWISLADVADHFLVFAWTDAAKQKARDHSGLSAFLLTREMKGLRTGTIHGKLGIRAGNTGSIVMDEVRVPAENLLGQEGEGFRIAMFALDQGRYTVAAGATGLIRACLDASVRYAKERTTFGRPIGEHQLVKEMIARMVRDYEVSRLLYLRAGWMKNQGLRNSRETSLAKWYATVASERAASDAVEVHGAYGYSDDYPVERYYR
ncbi:MAG: acyl-CoA dehydrogenase family protein, partial [Armatimonadota bacterium]|nr:acyl-CoA dehydrogenase family protein [Armatimonadota bacterium]